TGDAHAPERDAPPRRAIRAAHRVCGGWTGLRDGAGTEVARPPRSAPRHPTDGANPLGEPLGGVAAHVEHALPVEVEPHGLVPAGGPRLLLPPSADPPPPEFTDGAVAHHVHPFDLVEADPAPEHGHRAQMDEDPLPVDPHRHS